MPVKKESNKAPDHFADWKLKAIRSELAETWDYIKRQKESRKSKSTDEQYAWNNLPAKYLTKPIGELMLLWRQWGNYTNYCFYLVTFGLLHFVFIICYLTSEKYSSHYFWKYLHITAIFHKRLKPLALYTYIYNIFLLFLLVGRMCVSCALIKMEMQLSVPDLHYKTVTAQNGRWNGSSTFISCIAWNV